MICSTAFSASIGPGSLRRRWAAPHPSALRAATVSRRKNDRPASRRARRLPPERSLRRGEAGDWDAEGGARDVVETRLFAEGDRSRIAAVLAADAELEIGAGRATALGGDGDELADAIPTLSRPGASPRY
jgi:hypothetical protein